MNKEYGRNRLKTKRRTVGHVSEVGRGGESIL